MLGAFGLLLTAGHFIDKWSGGSLNPLTVIFGSEGPRHDWARPFGFVVLGFVYVALAIVVLGALPGPRSYAPAGSRTVKREPLPGSDSTSSRPFMRSTSSRQM